MDYSFPGIGTQTANTPVSGDWFALSQSAYAGLLAYWGFLQILLIIVAIFILVTGSEDLFVDLVYWATVLLRPFFGRRRPPTKDVVAKPERPIAILIPAWKEADVIGPMLRNSVEQFDYQNYQIFVGVYPNDAATRSEVDIVCAEHPNVHRVDVSHPGPTTKADCLNHLVNSALSYEQRKGIPFEIFVNHDAEDVVHGLELKVVNWFIDDVGMLQLPVLSLNRNPWDLVACHYMDEFAEWHGKDLVVRSAVSGMTPSAGVATALSRKAIDALRAERTGELFNVESLTEDYEIAHELRRLGFHSRFVRYWADIPTNRKSLFRSAGTPAFRRELITAREYFPDRVRTSYRQKSRWMLGICFFGWRRLGWQGDLVNRFFLWRDRKAVFVAPVAIIGYFLVIQWLLYTGLVWAIPGFGRLPPLVDKQWVWDIILINLGLMVNRLVHRAIFVGRAHGLRYVALSPVRAVVGNWISFLAFCRALRLFVVATLLRRGIRWDKTTHEFPTLGGHGVDRRLSEGARPSLEDAAVPIGLFQSDAGQLHDGGRQGSSNAKQNPTDSANTGRVERLFGNYSAFDPLAVPDEVREILPKPIAAQLSAFVVERLSPTEARIALTEPLARSDRGKLERQLAKSGVSKPVYQFALASDIAFGIRFAYDRSALCKELIEIDVLRRLGLINEYQEARIWRSIRRAYTPLGEALLDMGAIKRRELLRESRRRGNDGPELAERLRMRKLISADQLRAAAETQGSPPYDMLGLAVQAGFISLGTAETSANDAIAEQPDENIVAREMSGSA
jgi:adsorption protein B